MESLKQIYTSVLNFMMAMPLLQKAVSSNNEKDNPKFPPLLQKVISPPGVERGDLPNTADITVGRDNHFTKGSLFYIRR